MIKLKISEKETILKKISLGEINFEDLESKFRQERDIVIEALKHDRWALLYAADKFKKDKDIVLRTVKNNGLALELADDNLRGDRNIVLHAVKHCGYALKYASNKLQQDDENRKALETFKNLMETMVFK